MIFCECANHNTILQSKNKFNILLLSVKTSLWQWVVEEEDPAQRSVQSLQTNGVARAMQGMPFQPYTTYMEVASTGLLIIMLWLSNDKR